MALIELSINNFAVIKAAEVEFNAGFTVVSGETGAGKSIILDALNLVLGARAESALVRHGEQTSEINATFDASSLYHVQTWLKDRDLSNPDANNTVLIRRVVKENGPTKCYINDTPTTLSSLKELGILLVDIHGQHEHQSLLRKGTHRTIIDERANTTQAVSQIALLAKNIQQIQEELETLTQTASDNKDHLDLLDFQLNELVEAQLIENEFDALQQEYDILSNADELKAKIEIALEVLFDRDDNNVSSALGSQIVKLEKIKSLDSNVASAHDLIASALAQVDEAQVELNKALRHVDGDPERLADVEARRDLLINLARKHRCSENELLARQKKLQLEYDELIDGDAKPERLKQQLDSLLKDYQSQADDLTEKRSVAAKALADEISTQMQDLGMQGGRFEVQIGQRADDKPHVTQYGQDEIEFLVSTNTGMPLKPLNKTASGGELSRISLAIQVIASQSSSTPTLIFDEVDVGVGGGIAQIVGERLRKLGQNAQVICITHLPQVAALGAQHVLVEKHTESGQTSTSLTILDHDQRINELARMLGGIEITENTLIHAREMLSNATASAA